MKILITGAAGFMGKHLVKSLSQNKTYKIRCLLMRNTKKTDIDFLKNYNVEIIYGDIFEKKSLEKAMKNIEAVFHLAGGGKVETTFKKGFEDLKKLNIGTTERVINSAIKHKVKKFVHFSSISAMGIIIEKKLDENSECKPETPHEVCKYETEKIMEKNKKKILITIIRPGIVYGPYGLNSEILQLAKLLEKHFFIIPGNGKNIMPWIYVGDIVRATILAFKKNKKSCERFIVVSEPQPSFNELIDSIDSSMKKKAVILHMPKSIFIFAGYLFEKLGNLFNFAPLINSVRARSMTSNRIYNIDKIKKLGYKQENNLQDSIKKTINWYKKNAYI